VRLLIEPNPIKFNLAADETNSATEDTEVSEHLCALCVLCGKKIVTLRPL
jgi:hypothetical protein